TAGDVPSDLAIAIEWDVAGGALQSGSAAIDGSHREHASRPGRRASLPRPNLDQRTGGEPCSFASRGRGAGHSGPDGRDAVDNGYLWIGGIFGQQADARVGNSYRARRAAQGSVTSSAGTGIQITRFWFRRRIAPRNSGEPG